MITVSEAFWFWPSHGAAGRVFAVGGMLANLHQATDSSVSRSESSAGFEGVWFSRVPATGYGGRLRRLNVTPHIRRIGSCQLYFLCGILLTLGGFFSDV